MTTRAERRREERAFKKSGAVLAWCSAATVDAPFVASIARTMLADGQRPEDERRIIHPAGGFLNVVSGPRIVETRNVIAKNFMEYYPKAGWLVTVDADMEWDNAAIHRLLDAAEEGDFGVLGGLCFAGSLAKQSLYPTIYRAYDTDPRGLPMVERVLDYPKDAVVECDATGAAFIAIRRDVLQAIFDRRRYVTVDGAPTLDPHPWYAETYSPQGGQYGEDITFCLRARAEGYKVGVHTGIKIGHVKPHANGELEYDAQQAGPSPMVALGRPDDDPEPKPSQL